ncbi:hypothetical protein QTO34_012296 [Cnephaeus nilssonii]|uniref:Trichoplein keratin filament-binding protein n=1 Tax=Cnephaeus nilssonii TaxID=3371016 RepID=A0AA40HCK9_CNENI|nr:hypothetical protein QTO34_012296 [Eptesicus nilssonii]
MEEEENKRYENEYETARREALGRMKAEEERRQLEDKLQAEALLQQMEELKVQELEATKLKKERENLLKQRWELERLAGERERMAALRQKAELGRFLRHQYNAQLNRRAQQIQEELEADKRILQALLEKEEETQREHSARREQARADVAWMQQVLEQQLQREREQEAELQVLLREEAKEMWEKREAEWARERSARDRLMAEVLTGRQQQIQEKIEQNRRAQEESLRHREQLIQNLEEARESARREKEESEELKSARKQELEAQVGPSGRSSLGEGMRAAATGPVWTLHRGGTGFRALAYVQPGTLPCLKPVFIYLLLMQFTLHCRASSLWGSLSFLPAVLFLSASANTAPWATSSIQLST